jgi:hypothetical protein
MVGLEYRRGGALRSDIGDGADVTAIQLGFLTGGMALCVDDHMRGLPMH